MHMENDTYLRNVICNLEGNLLFITTLNLLLLIIFTFAFKPLKNLKRALKFVIWYCVLTRKSVGIYMFDACIYILLQQQEKMHFYSFYGMFFASFIPYLHIQTATKFNGE